MSDTILLTFYRLRRKRLLAGECEQPLGEIAARFRLSAASRYFGSAYHRFFSRLSASPTRKETGACCVKS